MPGGGGCFPGGGRATFSRPRSSKKQRKRMRFFPFSAIVGQDLLKKGLLSNAVDPSIGGVLIRGEKGTGKTTAVRAFAAVLPPLRGGGSAVRGGCRGRPRATRTAPWRWWTFR